MLSAGINANIRAAYTFICQNYSSHDDELVLVGFSRGAFTARPLASLLNDVGVLRKSALKHLRTIFDLWKYHHRQNPTRETSGGRRLFNALYDLNTQGHLIQDVKIRACAVWDTVGALPGDKLGFVDERIAPNIELAVHALALNEERSQFKPLLWRHRYEPTASVSTSTLKQCWFLGTHSDIRGWKQIDRSREYILGLDDISS